ncbi:MAG: polysaccharide pyruvyl transferase family protein [Rhodobacteraceae bacterium]|nr:polysaccharide pyruvyl transferase family protein [Paracoccaceae bacterium]
MIFTKAKVMCVPSDQSPDLAGKITPLSDAPLKIVQVGLRFSPNLGDGVISDCIAHGLTQFLPNAQVRFLDMSGRTQAGDQVVRNRSLALKVLETLPAPLARMLVQNRLNKLIDTFEDAWCQQLKADFAVIGGGQIFSDKLLNFPIKIGRVALILAAGGVPAAVFAAGVSKNWSTQGTRLFRSLAALNPALIGLRDAGSIASWTAQFGAAPAPTLTVDPGLLAAACYGPATGDATEVGLCVTDFGVLKHHADAHVAGSRSEPVRFYVETTRALVAAGHHVALFSNGEHGDEDLLARVKAAVMATPDLTGKARVEARADSPAHLARRIGGYSCVIAHRLHACILAYSYGRPLVGLGWDKKLSSFFTMIKQEAHYTDAPDLSGPQIAELANSAMTTGVDTVHHARMQRTSLEAFETLAQVVVSQTRAE